tara:strand:- start:12916 stop:13314 length:399 start_codon:yes stop_codon:yes gene_type:complete
MKYTLKDIVKQALEDRSSVMSTLPQGFSVIGLGVKLQSFPSQTEILNCSKGGDYFKEIEISEYNYFFNNGWKKGKLKVAINNCLYKLDLIEVRMKEEMNTRKNDKHIQNLKTRRENVLVKYAKHNQKLNQLN